MRGTTVARPVAHAAKGKVQYNRIATRSVGCPESCGSLRWVGGPRGSQREGLNQSGDALWDVKVCVAVAR